MKLTENILTKYFSFRKIKSAKEPSYYREIYNNGFLITKIDGKYTLQSNYERLTKEIETVDNLIEGIVCHSFDIGEKAKENEIKKALNVS